MQSARLVRELTKMGAPGVRAQACRRPCAKVRADVPISTLQCTVLGKHTFKSGGAPVQMQTSVMLDGEQSCVRLTRKGFDDLRMGANCT